MTTNEQWIRELAKNFYYYDPDELGEDAFKRLGDDEIGDVQTVILQRLQEEYKRGYIDGGIAQLTKQEEQ